MNGAGRRSLLAALACVAMLSGILIGVAVPPAAAALTSVRGSACTYWVNLGLFGGPQTLNGCGELVNGVPRPPGPWPTAPPPASQADHTDPSYAPHVALPADGSGSATAITAKDDSGAKAQYGPATAHGGLWPPNVASATPSGPQFASTVGTPDGGTVNSFAEIRLHPEPYPQATCATGFSPPCYDPGGFGGPPLWGNSLRAECTATEAGVTGSATFSNSFYATATDARGAPLPSATFAIPEHPAPNTVIHGVITNVGDVFAAVFNQQIVNPDNSLTVNALHVYLMGPTAVGEVVRGQVNCGTAPSAATATDTIAPTCGLPVVERVGPDDPTPKEPRTELAGVFDAGTGAAPSGITSVSDIQATNATVSVGNPRDDYPQYTKLTPGQTGPLPITATRIDESLPMSWSFKVTDAAGNVSTCSGVPPEAPTELTIDNPAVSEGDSGSSVLTFFVTRSGGTGATSTVKMKTTGGTATPGTDYTVVPLNTVLTFNPGVRSVPVDIAINGDTLNEKDETFNLVLSSPTGAILADSTGTATIRNDDVPAFLSVSSLSVSEGNSGTTPVTFNVTRSGNTTGETTVTYTTTGGNAAAGTDYTTVDPATVTFSAGQTSKLVTTNVIGDTVDEANETFTLKLSAAVGATLADPVGTVYITDEDGTTTAPVAPTFLEIGDPWFSEGNTGATASFTVTRYGVTTGASTVRYKTIGGTATAGTDYTAPPLDAFLSFAAGELTKTVAVAVAGDSLPEANETFNVVLSTPTNATLGDSTGTATILNDDGSAFLSVANLSVIEGDAGTTAAMFTVSRTGNTNGASTVKAKTGGGTATAGNDYTAITAVSVSFAAGQTSQAVAVEVTSDNAVESNETFNLVLSAATGATIIDVSGTATITDDD